MKIFRVPAVFLKVFAEVENKIIDRAGGRVDIVTPNRLEDLFPWHHIILVLDQQFEQHGFFLA